MVFMNQNLLIQKLIAAGRRNIPGNQVPYAFEKRIMARLAAASVPDGFALWAQALWCAAVPCFAVVVLLGVSSFFLPVDNTGNIATTAPTTELSQDFENTLLATVDQPVNVTEDAR